jgi:hypothetical protein
VPKVLGAVIGTTVLTQLSVVPQPVLLTYTVPLGPELLLMVLPTNSMAVSG